MKQRTISWIFVIAAILAVAVFLFHIATSKEPERRPPAAPQKIGGPTLPA